MTIQFVTFFDRIYQGLGMSNGQTGAAMLQNNQKLKSDESVDGGICIACLCQWELQIKVRRSR